MLLKLARSFIDADLPIKLFVLDIWWVHNDPNGAPQRHCMFNWEPAGADARAGVELFPRGPWNPLPYVAYKTLKHKTLCIILL